MFKNNDEKKFIKSVFGSNDTFPYSGYKNDQKEESNKKVKMVCTCCKKCTLKKINKKNISTQTE